MAATVGANCKDNWQPFPELTMAQVNADAVLVQPAGRELRSVVRARFVAALPSSVVKLIVTGCPPAPRAAVTWPIGELVATMLLAVVAAYARVTVPPGVCSCPALLMKM